MHQTIHIKAFLPGLCLSLFVAAVSLLLANVGWLQQHAVGTLTLAILLGILVGNTFYPIIAARCARGVLFSRQRLLQTGIILYGLRLTFTDIVHVGVRGVLIDVLVLSSTFALAWFAGRKLFRLDNNTAILIGAGSSICGAAAVMATEPVVCGRTEQVSVAVSTVLVFGTLGMLIYPALFNLNLGWHFLPTTSHAFGVFTGSTVHEVAQVVAAAKPLGDETTNTAVIEKMVRVMMLAPFLMLLSVYLSRVNSDKQTMRSASAVQTAKITIPWFAVIFIAVAGLNSLSILPPDWVAQAISLDSLLLAMAMAALGLSTHFSAIRKAGVKPLLLGALLFVWLITGGTLINASVMSWPG